MDNQVDKILDENCDDNITLYDEDGNPCEFEQIAVIPMDEKLYCILRPVDMPDIPEDEALVFELEEANDEEILSVVMEDDIVDKVFDEYYKLLDEE